VRHPSDECVRNAQVSAGPGLPVTPRPPQTCARRGHAGCLSARNPGDPEGGRSLGNRTRFTHRRFPVMNSKARVQGILSRPSAWIRRPPLPAKFSASPTVHALVSRHSAVPGNLRSFRPSLYRRRSACPSALGIAASGPPPQRRFFHLRSGSNFRMFY
jgi:hypothetical protein